MAVAVGLFITPDELTTPTFQLKTPEAIKRNFGNCSQGFANLSILGNFSLCVPLAAVEPRRRVFTTLGNHRAISTAPRQ